MRILMLFIAALLTCAAHAKTLQGIVTHVSDGDTLGRLQHRGEDVGAWLVTNGHAWRYHHRRSLGTYANEQTQAKAKRTGLWAQSTSAMEPRLFRKSHGSCRH
jgi:micrococcal nuclease